MQVAGAVLTEAQVKPAGVTWALVGCAQETCQWGGGCEYRSGGAGNFGGKAGATILEGGKGNVGGEAGAGMAGAQQVMWTGKQVQISQAQHE